MISPQPELFDAPRHSADGDVAWLEKLLKGGQCWMTAGDILLSLGRPQNEDNKRWLRALASESGYIISGQKGYRHLEHCAPEEIHHFAAGMESQAKQMAVRAGRIRVNAHKLFS
jgi:hypothetical protein